MYIKRVLIIVCVLLGTLTNASTQAPDDPDGSQKGPRLIYPVAPRSGAVRTAPSNDNIASAAPIAALPYSHQVEQFDLVTSEVDEPIGECISNDYLNPGAFGVWYSITFTDETIVTFDTYGSSFDAVLSVFTGSDFASFNELRCNDDFSILSAAGLDATLASVTLYANQTYWIRLAARSVNGLLENDYAVLNARLTPTAGTFVVDSLEDQIDVNPGDGFCLAANGHCTLRAAINEANGSQPGSIITLPEGLYALTKEITQVPVGSGFRVLYDDAAYNGDLDIITNIEIIGAGADRSIIDGTLLDGVFHIMEGSYVRMFGVTVRNGHAAGYEAEGGGIRIEGNSSVSLESTWITQNQAVDGGGIAVSFEGGTIDIVDSAITNNFAFGTIYGSGVVSAGRGGGIYIPPKRNSNVTLRLQNVTVSGNIASTPDTSANPMGGGIYLGARDGAAGVLNANFHSTTIAANAAINGGGIFIGADSNLTTHNTLIGENVATINPDCRGELGSTGTNIIGNAAGCVTDASDIVNKDVRLNPLFVNGPGGTPTHLPRANSPARDALDVMDCVLVTKDQRGIDRPQGAKCDIGALEIISGVTPEPVALLSPADNTVFASSGVMPPVSWTKSPSAYTYKVSFITTLGVVVYERNLRAVDVCDAVVVGECTYIFDGVLDDDFYRYNVEAYVDTTSPDIPTAPHLVQIDSVVGLTNLLANGGFETKGTKKQALKWNAKKVSGDKRVCNTSTATVSYSDNCAYRFKGTKLEKSSIRQKLNLNGLTLGKDRVFRFSFYSKSSETVRAHVMMKVIYKKKSIKPSKRKILLPAGDKTWTPINGEVILKHRRVDRVILIFTHLSKKGNWVIDDARAIYLDGTVTRESTMTTRDANGDLLPLPPAPDGFRGSN